ncbi:MAG: LLM class flavin-dependent oxidoreductase [Chloroflexi bacterium]|nr:LLM class flavin-dependent oxidoreductase [Chloroflexota bacterium]
MTDNHRVEFGWVVQPAPRSPEHRDSLRADNQRFLELIRNHFQTVWLEDHFQWISPQGSRNTLEGWTHLCYLLAHFTEFRFGTLVLGQSYRHPALLAKMAATLHYLSDGRFILGIGAGWKDDEYRAYGWPFPSPGVRTRQLDEYTQVIKLMLTQSPASFEGKYYSIKDAHNDPLPNPPLPLMIGGNGERGTLRTTAQYADWWNFPLRAPELFEQKVGVLRKHCDAVGRNFDEIVLSAFQFVSLTHDPAKIQRSDQLNIIGGNADEVTRGLEAFVSRGARHFMLRFVDFPNTEGIELFLEKVLPRFR